MGASVSLRKRSKKGWTIILSWYETGGDGIRRRLQRQEVCRGSKAKASARAAEILTEFNRGEWVEPSNLTVGQWLDFWVENRVKVQTRLRTYESYESIIKNHLKPGLGTLLLQELDSLHLEKYYLEKGRTLSQTSLEHHHSVISGALKWALKKGLISKNPAPLVDNRPSVPEERNEAKVHCWSAEEAKSFMDTAKSFGPQAAALYSLALETGMRKGELLGLLWESVDLTAGRIMVERQIVKYSRPPVYGPLKRGRARSVSISAETAQLHRDHRLNQNELKLQSGGKYADQGLVFAKEWDDLRSAPSCLGDPLQGNNIGQRQFATIIKKAGVSRIKFHGLRHTAATLLLRAGVPPHVVAERLGHKGIEITLNIYAHVLPDQQQDAAAKLGTLLHG